MASVNEWIERTGDRLGRVAAIERIESLVESLSPRDRRLLTGLTVFFTVALFAGGAYLVKGALDKQETQITYKTEQLVRAQEILLESGALRARVDGAEARLKGRQGLILQSFIEKEVLAAGITQDKLQNLNPRSEVPGERYKQTVVEVQLKEITLDSLVRFLHSIEYGDVPIHVKSLRVHTGRRQRSDLDVDLELLVVSLASEA